MYLLTDSDFILSSYRAELKMDMVPGYTTNQHAGSHKAVHELMRDDLQGKSGQRDRAYPRRTAQNTWLNANAWTIQALQSRWADTAFGTSLPSLFIHS